MPLRLGTCFKSSTVVTNTTRRALSNGIIRFPVAQTMSVKSPKHQYFTYEFNYTREYLYFIRVESFDEVTFFLQVSLYITYLIIKATVFFKLLNEYYFFLLMKIN